MITNKKGIQLNQAFGAVLVVVLVAVLVIIAIFLFDTLADTGVNQARTVLNEAGGELNISGYTLANADVCGFNTPGIAQATNVTNGGVILAANYTVSAAGVVTNATTQTFSDVSFNYTYNDRGATCNATEEMTTQFATYPALVGLVGTIVFLGLVIGVLVASFIFGGRGSRV